jgi:CheY-like chemotaxis protein
MKPDEIKMTTVAAKGDGQSKIKILVVEDVPNVATVLAARLESFGYDVCDVVASGLKAIVSAIKHKPDLILMDILIEGDMNGIEAAEKIVRQLDTPIIYLSCLNDEAVMDRAIQTHPYGYIVKPYDSAELHFCIKNALNKHRDIQNREKRIAELEARDRGTHDSKSS